MLKLSLLALLLFAASFAHAGEVAVEVLEKQAKVVTAYIFDTQSGRLKVVDRITGKEIPQVSTYTVRDRKVMFNGKTLANAEEILYQCQIDGADLLIVRVEHNSFSSPFKWLAAFSGHPIQVSTINLLQVSNGELKSETPVARKEASYGWSAKIFK